MKKSGREAYAAENAENRGLNAPGLSGIKVNYPLNSIIFRFGGSEALFHGDGRLTPRQADNPDSQ